MKVRLWRADGPLFGTHRNPREVRTLLKGAANPPTIDLYPRSDGPGSSLDLPQFLAMGSRIWSGPVDLHDDRWAWSQGCLRTPGACLDIAPVRFSAVPATNAEVVEYFAPDFHTEPLKARRLAPGIPHYFVNNILLQFGLTGVRIEALPMPAVYRGTGLGGSNLAHAAALIFASALSGANLTLSQLYIWGTFLENNFGIKKATASCTSYGLSLTGGQEMLTAFQGGLADNVHVPFIFGPHAVVSRELVPSSRYDELAKHFVLVNLGSQRSPTETSRDVNSDWIGAWANIGGAEANMRKVSVAYDAVEALRALDFRWYAETMRDYRELRAELCPHYLDNLEDVAALCRLSDCQYFPLGAGGGTCLICAPEPDSLTSFLQDIENMQNLNSRGVVLPFAVRQEGVNLHGFEELGFRTPRQPEVLA